jgi:hypothetical protein
VVGLANENAGGFREADPLCSVEPVRESGADREDELPVRSFVVSLRLRQAGGLIGRRPMTSVHRIMVRVVVTVATFGVVPMRPGMDVTVSMEFVLGLVMVPEAFRNEHEPRSSAEAEQDATRYGQTPEWTLQSHTRWLQSLAVWPILPREK